MIMRMPEIDQTIIRRRTTIAEQLRRIVGREWVLDSEAERRPYECDGLTASPRCRFSSCCRRRRRR
jgi:glycolate oxidase